MKTNQCPLVGSCPRCRRTRPDNPSNEQRISVGCVHSQIRPAEVAFNTTGSFALEEPHHHRAPAPHPTTRIGPAQPPRPRQTSIRTVRFAVPYCAAYVSKDRRYSLTHPVTNRSLARLTRVKTRNQFLPFARSAARYRIEPFIPLDFTLDLPYARRRAVNQLNSTIGMTAYFGRLRIRAAAAT